MTKRKPLPDPDEPEGPEEAYERGVREERERWEVRLAEIRRIDLNLVRKGDPDLCSIKLTEAQRCWILHLGLSRALEILGK